ncbi:MAG: choice-of-anchor D domain-containing protein [Luteolibacter sp.]|uniref:choice-of-anchor D domain-containing protein n=1 Tax=Luteolibacter sp. TaxID=1962973 RepID=UPI0032644E0A
MKPIFLIFALCSVVAHAQLVITEVMASSSHPSQSSPTPDANGDWWELTNIGSITVNLSGYTWDDIPTPANPTVSTFPSGVSILPGESIVILEEPVENVSTWRAAWGLTSATNVINRTQVSNTGGEGFSGLGVSGDEVNLYNVAGTLVAHVEFGPSIVGRSQAFLRDGTPIHALHSVAGQQGAVASNLSPSDTGSPGDAGIHFTSTPVANGKSTYSYPITAVKSGAAAPTITATGLPSFLTLTAGAAGTATLANNRPLTIEDTGDYLVQLTATSGTSTIQQYVLTILNPLPSVILNEYNAVAASNFLNGGTELADDDGGPASADTHFGRVLWNGGQWVEFVVVGESGSPVDMRDWEVEIGTNSGSGFTVRNTVVFSNNTAWQAVAPGTILTMIDRTTAQGGLDTGFALRDRSATVGDIWTNVWMGDPTYITYTSLEVNGYTSGAGVVSGIVIDNNATQFRVRNNLGQIVFGPVGEGVAPRNGTSSKEIFELKGHPTPAVSPVVAATASTRGYDDGGSESTFGFPNNWPEGATVVTQDFINLTAPEIVVEQQPAGTDLADGSNVSFASLYVGTDVSLTFTIRNSGTANLTDLTITKDGTDAADFTITANPTAPLAAPDGTTTFTVKFAPTVAGSKVAAIHIASNDADEGSFDLNLFGTALVNLPEITVSQPAGVSLNDGTAKLSFGTVVIGKTGTAKKFIIKNNGKANLTGLALTKNGLNAADFVITAPAVTVLAPGKSTFFNVSFKPTAKGTRNAAIHLKSNDANENPFDIKLTGAGAVKK